MDYFIILNIATVTFIIIETCVVFYLSNKKKFPPQWYSLKLFVYLSSWTNLMKAFSYICCCFCCKTNKNKSEDLESLEYSNTSNAKNNEDVGTNSAQLHTDNDDFNESFRETPSSGSNNNNTNEKVDGNTKGDSNIMKEYSNVSNSDSYRLPTYTSAMKKSRHRDILLASRLSSSIENLGDSHVTYKKLGLAIDVLLQIFISLCYIIFTSILLVQATERR